MVVRTKNGDGMDLIFFSNFDIRNKTHPTFISIKEGGKKQKGNYDAFNDVKGEGGNKEKFLAAKSERVKWPF